MKSLTLRLYFITVLIRLCISRNRVNLLDDSLRTYGFQNAPKKWFTYLKIFLHKWINKIYLQIISQLSIFKMKISYNVHDEDSRISKEISFFGHLWNNFHDKNCHVTIMFFVIGAFLFDFQGRSRISSDGGTNRSGATSILYASQWRI